MALSSKVDESECIIITENYWLITSLAESEDSTRLGTLQRGLASVFLFKSGDSHIPSGSQYSSHTNVKRPLHQAESGSEAGA